MEDRSALRGASTSGDEGFTLIELLIVIVTLGILSAVVVFSLGSVVTSSARASCNADAKSVAISLEHYKALVGTYPGLGATGKANLLSSANGGPFLRSWPSNASHYVISLDASTLGQVDIQTVTGGVTSSTLTVYEQQGTTAGCSIVT